MKIRNNSVVRIITVILFIILIGLLSYRSTKVMSLLIYGKINTEIFSFKIMMQLFSGFYSLLFSAILTKGKL